MGLWQILKVSSLDFLNLSCITGTQDSSVNT